MSLIKDIDEFKLKYDTANFFEENKLSEVVLEYYIKTYSNVSWWNISKYQTLSEQFIIKYIDRVTWWNISKYQTLSEAFITKYIDKVSWYGLFRNKKITLRYEFIVEHLYEFNLYGMSIYTSDNNINRLVEEFPDKYNIDRIAYEFNSNN